MTDRKLRAQRNLAGYRIGDGTSVDLFRYIAWLMRERHAPKSEVAARKPEEATDYESIKERARARSQAASEKGRDIGPLPRPADPARRRRCEKNFKLFCETYFPEIFYLAWSEDHLRVIAKIEKAAVSGGLFAFAMPRGSGKSALCLAATLWALLNGWRNFVFIVGATEDAAKKMLESLKMHLDRNELLAADYPEACHAIQRLAGQVNRQKGQLLDGERTFVGFKSDELVLPTLKLKEWRADKTLKRFTRPNGQSFSSGAIIRVAGITGQIRGAHYTRPDGKLVRPDLVIPDDPQTDESAKSPQQVIDRLAVINGAVLGLAGPGKKISGFMPVTVISPDDLAERVLNTDTCPEWHGERLKMMKAMPTNVDWWNKYREVRADGLRRGEALAPATALYLAEREQADEGAIASWPARYNPDEVSAVQSAMNLLFRDEDAFWAEYQNEPRNKQKAKAPIVSPAELALRVTALERDALPADAQHVACHVDVQEESLFYTVVAANLVYTGGVIRYGTYPDFGLRYFTRAQTEQWAKVSRAFFEKYPQHASKATQTTSGALRAPYEAKIYFALSELVPRLLNMKFARPDGVTLSIARLGIDTRGGKASATIKRFVKDLGRPEVVCTFGRGIRPDQKQYEEYQRTPGWLFEDMVNKTVREPAWIFKPGQDGQRFLEMDVNRLKTFTMSRLACPIGMPGAITLHSGTPSEHELFCDHVAGSEYPEPIGARGRIKEMWKPRDHNPDNDFLDNLVACMALLSMCGVSISTAADGSQPPRKGRTRKRLSELWREKNQRR